jgi:NAD(P)-dependent dehydrogenase (short-subunit alcohol dehydrogenase family)
VRLQSEVAVVTGASKGIGLAIAQALVKEGVHPRRAAGPGAGVEGAGLFRHRARMVADVRVACRMPWFSTAATAGCGCDAAMTRP